MTTAEYEWRRKGEDWTLDGSRYWLKKRRGKTFAIMFDNKIYMGADDDVAGSKRLVEALEDMTNDGR